MAYREPRETSFLINIKNEIVDKLYYAFGSYYEEQYHRVGKTIAFLYILFGTVLLGNVVSMFKNTDLQTDVRIALGGGDVYFWGRAVGYAFLIGGGAYFLINRIFNSLNMRHFYSTYMTTFIVVAVVRIISWAAEAHLFQEPTYSTIANSIKNPDISIWNRIQNELNCCGDYHYSSWFNHNLWPLQEYIPDSCCDPENSYAGCGREPVDSNYSRPGCVQLAWRVFNDNSVSTLVTFAYYATNTISVCLSVVGIVIWDHSYRIHQD